MTAIPKLHDFTTHEVKSYVRAYLLARTHAQLTRARVNATYREILTECPVYATDTGRPILDPGHLYLSDSEAHVRDAYDEADKRLRAAGVKPANMPVDHCPALVAEHLQINIERQLIEAAGRPLGITNDGLLSLGLDDRQKFIDLVVGLIVNQPDFTSPL